MEIEKLRCKACRSVDFLIIHLGFDKASDYVNTMSDFIDSKKSIFKKVAEDCCDDFNSIKNLTNGQRRKK